MNPAGKDAEGVSVAGGNVDEHVIRESGCTEEHEETMFGGFHGRNIASEVLQSGAEIGTWLTENPPIVPVRGTIVLIPLRLHVVYDVLVNSWKSVAHFVH